MAVFVMGGVIWMAGKDPVQIKDRRAVSATEVDYHILKTEGKVYHYDTSQINFLFMGVDSATDDMAGQADTLFLISCDRNKKEMDVISLSRDAMVPIQVFDASGKNLGWESQHLGLAFSYGTSPEQGCRLTAEAVSRCLNHIPIIYYMASSLSSIAAFQDLVGSITVTIPGDDLAHLGEDYEKGKELTIDSSNVEMFLRTRNTQESYSNGSRMERQRVYVNAYIEKLRDQLKQDYNQTVQKMVQVSKKLVTNCSLEDMGTFAEMIMTYSFEEENYHEVVGTNQMGMFHDEYVIDEDVLQKLLLDVFYIEETESMTKS